MTRRGLPRSGRAAALIVARTPCPHTAARYFAAGDHNFRRHSHTATPSHATQNTPFATRAPPLGT